MCFFSWHREGWFFKKGSKDDGKKQMLCRLVAVHRSPEFGKWMLIVIF